MEAQNDERSVSKPTERRLVERIDDLLGQNNALLRENNKLLKEIIETLRKISINTA
jgi:hypothetical protein